MIVWVIAFFIIALVAAALGYSAFAGVAMGLAEIAILVVIVLLVIGAVAAVLRGRKPTLP